jgi:hypothetical protein
MPSRDVLHQQLLATPLFAEKIWKLSPEPWPITEAQLKELKVIGGACLSYQRALERLYVRSFTDKKILRNREVHAKWVSEYLDRYKPAGLIEHGRHRSIKGQHPIVLRPDLLITEQGFTMTELDSVPGGIGLTAYLNEVYAEDFPKVIGSTKMPEQFARSLGLLTPQQKFPLIAITVSEEAATYRPEFEWLSEKLRELGHDVHVVDPSQIMQMGDGSYIPVDGAPRKVDTLYRFFELFDLANVKGADGIFNAVENGSLVLTPPMKAFQEEKLGLALIHHPLLVDFWKENLPENHLEALMRIVPRTWIMERSELPPTAVLHAPTVNHRPIRDWAELAEASQKERHLIIKASGFHETAWGARSVTLGSDVSREEWLEAIETAVNPDNETFYVMQDYHKPSRLQHPVYQEDGSTTTAEGRVRLCPYFFAQGDSVELSGILATFCPADKKIIHGMSDAALLPCHLVS